MTKHTSPRTLDHMVLPVADIDVARARYEQLGFTVAPDGKHPFGTENCCVFFEDGTFLEPLGIAHRETCEEKALKGNTFVANDQAFRFRRGIEGFSHLVIKSGDAKADDKLYKSNGISAGRMVRFARPFATPDGEKGRVAFHLAFAQDKRSPDAGFFSCEVINPPKVDRSALQAHKNGVVCTKEVVLSEINPTDFQYFFQTYLNQREMDVDSFGMSFETSNGRVSVLSPDGMKAFYDIEVESLERGLMFQVMILGVEDLNKTRETLVATKTEFNEQSGRLTVSPAPGQGTTICFEEVA